MEQVSGLDAPQYELNVGAGIFHSVGGVLSRRQTDRQTDRQIDRQTDRRTDGQTDRQTDGQTELFSPFLFCADNDFAEVGKNDGGPKPLELGNQLHKQLLHELMDHATESRLVEEGVGGTDPPGGRGGGKKASWRRWRRERGTVLHHTHPLRAIWCVV